MRSSLFIWFLKHDLTMQPRLAWSLWSPKFCLLSAEITGMCHNVPSEKIFLVSSVPQGKSLYLFRFSYLCDGSNIRILSWCWVFGWYKAYSTHLLPSISTATEPLLSRKVMGFNVLTLALSLIYWNSKRFQMRQTLQIELTITPMVRVDVRKAVFSPQEFYECQGSPKEQS